jgi:hypothetical protein
MTFLLKDPGAVLDYSIDWGADYLDGDMLAGSEWSVEPDEPGGVTVAGSDFDATSSSVKAAGGAPGSIYKLINRVTLQSGLIDERSIVIRVEER